MPVTLNFGNYQNYTLNESRLAHLLSADKEKATHMGRWDKLQDHFRSEKKRPCAGSAIQHYSRSGPWGTWRDGR